MIKLSSCLTVFLMFPWGGTGFVWGHPGHEQEDSQPAGTRTWKDAQGVFELDASFVWAGEHKVQLLKADGQLVTLSADALSNDDRVWIRQRQAAIRQINENAQAITLAFAPDVRPNQGTPKAAASFQAFAKLQAVKYRWDERYLYVESNSMPAHNMMVGITAWQQQVPIPQPYSGDNAWRIPLHPIAAKSPMSAKSHFFKGAIALAANGVPIFNPIKTNGRTDTFLAGELDEFGGHCGRADDYHYHIAPTHLQKIVGADKPVAYALDGYAIYGFTEPDGSPVENLDEFNGHETPELGYHYHSTKSYPYLNGGFHGEVVERNGQVDPQPRTGGVRPYLPPLAGAKIVGFTKRDNKIFSVKYEVGDETRYVNYMLNADGSVTFDFVDASGKTKTETYSPRQRGKGGSADRPPREGEGNGGPDRPRPEVERAPKPRPNTQRETGPREDRANSRESDDEAAPASAPLVISPKRSGNFILSSPAVADGAPLPDEYNGNGEGATPQLAWKGAPEGTKSYALVMDHIDRDGVLKTYWLVYDIPPDVTGLPKNAQGIGRLGATWKPDRTYVPPHSRGGALQTYTLHLYALSVVPNFDDASGKVTREALLTSIKEAILDSAELKVTYKRPRDEPRNGNDDREKKDPK